MIGHESVKTFDLLSKSIPEILAKNNFDMTLFDNNYNYAKLFSQLGRKYINFFSDDVISFLSITAFTTVFITHYDRYIGKFSGSFKGSPISLYQYVGTLYAVELIELGKNQSKIDSRQVQDTVVDGDSEFHISDYIRNTSKKVRVKSMNDIYYIDFLNEILQTSTNKRELEFAKRELERVNKDDGLRYADFDDGTYTVDEEIDFCSIKDGLLKYIKQHTSDKIYKLCSAVIELLCQEFHPKEICCLLRIEMKEFKDIHKHITNSLVDMYSDDSCSMYGHIKQYTNDFTKFNLSSKHFNNIPDENELYEQVRRISQSE